MSDPMREDDWEPGPDECGWIWLQDDEQSGVAECGCRLYASFRESGPAMFLCKLHGDAPKLAATITATLATLKSAVEELGGEKYGRPKVCVLRIEHRHGSTTTVHASKQAALDELAAYVGGQWSDEIPDEEMPSTDDEAIDRYFEVTGARGNHNESYELEELEMKI